MFEARRTCAQSPIAEDTMSQQHSSSPPQAVLGASPDMQTVDVSWLQSEAHGRDRFRRLLQQWLRRNQWSLAVVSRLAELSLLATARGPVPDWSAGMPLEDGSLVNHRGHAWLAIGRPLSEPSEGEGGWRELGLTSRLHASGLNLFLRGQTRNLNLTFLLELGRLNLWVADVQAGRAAPPVDRRMRDLVTKATVIADEEGALGPEELAGIAVGRFDAPPWPDPPVEAAPKVQSSVSARALRAAAAAACLDIVEDWATIASLYPTSDRQRVERLQQVLRGAQWSEQQAEDEQAACLVLLQRLQSVAAERDRSNASSGASRAEGPTA
jgi:hypothetical protein